RAACGRERSLRDVGPEHLYPPPRGCREPADEHHRDRVRLLAARAPGAPYPNLMRPARAGCLAAPVGYEVAFQERKVVGVTEEARLVGGNQIDHVQELGVAPLHDAAIRI